MKISPQAKINFRAGRMSPAVTIAILIGLAAIAGVLIWMLLRPSGAAPLENLKDDGVITAKIEGVADFDPSDLADMPADSEIPSGAVAIDEVVSAESTFALGETKRIGNIEVTPLRIEKRTAQSFEKSTPDELIETGELFVLVLRVKNVSKSQTFAPLDPAYLYPSGKRKVMPSGPFKGRPVLYSYIHPVGSFDTAIFPHDLDYANWGFVGHDFPVLAPGEQAELTVISEADVADKVKSPMLWRVKLRKGLTATGKGVATVIAVRFAPEDMKKSE